MTRHTTRPVVIVDAYSRGAVLTRAFAELAPCIHVRSRPEMPEIFVRTFQPALFQEDLAVAELGLDGTIAALRERSPIAVVAGSEFGIELVDVLSAALGVCGNGAALSSARRNKREMADAVARHGLAVPARCEAVSLPDAISWFEGHGGSVVVKPVDSSGSDHVFVCRSAAEVEHAWRTIHGTTNIMMRPNASVLLQEYLEGDEYAINTVSSDGRHWFTDVWRYTKRLVSVSGTQRRIYDRDDLLDPDCAEVAQLVPYARGVLDALGIRHGPAHVEIFLTASGPRLVETGARIVGNVNPPVLKAATGADQVELTVRCYTDPARMHDSPLLYARHKHVCCLNLIVTHPGVVDRVAIESFLSRLASFSDMRFRVPDGDRAERTVDMSTSPGTFFLIHDDPSQIERDYAAFREFELTCYAAGR